MFPLSSCTSSWAACLPKQRVALGVVSSACPCSFCIQYTLRQSDRHISRNLGETSGFKFSSEGQTPQWTKVKDTDKRLNFFLCNSCSRHSRPQTSPWRYMKTMVSICQKKNHYFGIPIIIQIISIVGSLLLLNQPSQHHTWYRHHCFESKKWKWNQTKIEESKNGIPKLNHLKSAIPTSKHPIFPSQTWTSPACSSSPSRAQNRPGHCGIDLVLVWWFV